MAGHQFSMDEIFHGPDLHPLRVTGTEEERLEEFIKVRDEIRFCIEKEFVMGASRQAWTLLLHAEAL